MQGVTAEYGPARAQKNQTGKWYPQIPVDHTTLQINQRVVNTTLIPVKNEHWIAPNRQKMATNAGGRARNDMATSHMWARGLAV